MIASCASAAVTQVDDPISAARFAAGDRWASQVDRLCGMGGERPPMPPLPKNATFPITLPEVENWPEPAARIFDNLYFVGSKGVSAFAIVTPDGIIITDAMWAYDVERSVAGGLRSFGIDPAKIKYVIIPHGHPDHYGGANFLHDSFGAKIVAPKGDLEMIKEYAGRDTTPVPKGYDMLVGDGDTLTLGGTTVTFHAMPGHTPGGVAMSFPVNVKGKQHNMLIWAAGGATPNTAEKLQMQIPALTKLMEIAKERKFDALADNHGSHMPAAEWRTHPEKGNPFLVGSRDVIGYLEMRLNCDKARLQALGNDK